MKKKIANTRVNNFSARFLTMLTVEKRLVFSHDIKRVSRLPWVAIAALQGDARAQKNVGRLYEFVVGGVKRDFKRAAELYWLAAKAGVVSGFYELGRLYEYGKGVPQNLLGAAELYRKATMQVIVSVFFRLGEMHRLGKEITRNYDEAGQLHKFAAERGDAESQNILGSTFEHGHGVTLNLPHRLGVVQACCRRQRGRCSGEPCSIGTEPAGDLTVQAADVGAVWAGGKTWL